MIASAIVFFITGQLIMYLGGTREVYRHNVWDMLGCPLVLIGLVLGIAGIVKWAWEVLP